MGSLIAVLPFHRQAPVAAPQQAVAASNVMDAVSMFPTSPYFPSSISNLFNKIDHLFSTFFDSCIQDYSLSSSLLTFFSCARISWSAGPGHWVSVCAMSDCTFTCTIYNGNDQMESIFVPRPEEADPDYGATPDGTPESACITCTSDSGVLCVAAAWAMPLHKTHVRSIFLFEDSQAPGKLISEEVFTENPKSSLHAVSSLSIQCNKTCHRLCLVGSCPPSQSHSTQVDFSRKHVTAIEIIRMRQKGKPAGAPMCKVVHGLSSQFRDDINALQMELRHVIDQRVKAAPRSGELHAIGSSSSLSSTFVQFLRQSQWWQVRAFTMFPLDRDVLLRCPEIHR
jgi:hypothetical protein